MGLLTAEMILASDDIGKPVEVKVPEWATGEADTVLVWPLNGEERDEYQRSMWRNDGKQRVYEPRAQAAKLAALSIRDENRKRIFTDVQISQLGRKSAVALERVSVVADRLSFLRGEDLEDKAKNSETTESSASGSSSP